MSSSSSTAKGNAVEIDDSIYAGVAATLEEDEALVAVAAKRGLVPIKEVIGDRRVFSAWLRSGISPSRLTKYLRHVLTPKKADMELEEIRKPRSWIRKAVLNVHARSAKSEKRDVAEEEGPSQQMWTDAYMRGRHEAQSVAVACNFEALHSMRMRAHGFYACFHRHVSNNTEPVVTDDPIFQSGVAFATMLVSTNRHRDAWLEAAFCNGIIDFAFRLSELAGTV